MPARRTASATTSAPSAVAVSDFSAPRNFPVGVRTALTMTASRTSADPDLDVSHRRFPEHGLQPRENHARRPPNFVGPLLAGGVDDESPVFQVDGRMLLHGRPHGQAPDEVHLAWRQRRSPDELGHRARHCVFQRLHGGNLSAGYDFDVRLILASASPRRAELLAAAGFAFDVRVVNVDERVRRAEAPSAYVERLASEKSRAAHDAESGADVITLGADTAVVVDALILGKPVDEAQAAAMLRQLSGRSHDVLTGVSLRHDGRELTCVETTRVEVVALTDADIDWYVRTGEGLDKAGAYAIQGLASRFIPRIEGSYSNVVGLPVATVVALLGRLIRPPVRLASPG